MPICLVTDLYNLEIINSGILTIGRRNIVKYIWSAVAPVNSYPFEGKKKLSDLNTKLAYTADDKEIKSNDISISLLKFLGSSTICFFIY